MRKHFTTFACAICFAASVRGEDIEESLRTWGGLEKASLADLAAGKIVTECNASMRFARGISTKAAYFVVAPVGVTADILLNTDPSKDPQREVYQYESFQADDDAAFHSIKLDGQPGPIRKLKEATSSGKGLQLSSAERTRLPKSNTAGAAQNFWSDLLRDRWRRAITEGDLGSTATYDTRNELRNLLAEEQKVAKHFDVLLSPLNKLPASGLNPANHCWYVSNINGTAAVQLGAVYARGVDEQGQVLEVTYYSSDGYLGSFSLYELTPVTINGRKGTLVWQGSFASAVDLAGNFGLNRKIASTLMIRDVERSIRSFQKSAAAAASAKK